MKSSPTINRFYDTIARSKSAHKPIPFVVKFMNLTKIVSPDRNEVIFQLMKSGRRLLDIGVGEGDLALSARSTFTDVYGIDISPVRIRRLRKRVTDTHIHLSVQNIEERMVFRKDYFDAVSMVAILEHVFDPHEALREIRRILKSNGLLYISVPNIAWFYPRLSLLLGRFPLTSTDPGFDGGHLHYFDIHNLTQLLTDHRFVIETLTCSGFFSRIRSIYPPLLGGDLIVVARKISP